jgi:hypothetical protein
MAIVSYIYLVQVTSGDGAGSGYGQRYIVNMGNMVRGIRQRALHHSIQEKYDVPTARICKVRQLTAVTSMHCCDICSCMTECCTTVSFTSTLVCMRFAVAAL